MAAEQYYCERCIEQHSKKKLRHYAIMGKVYGRYLCFDCAMYEKRYRKYLEEKTQNL